MLHVKVIRQLLEAGSTASCRKIGGVLSYPCCILSHGKHLGTSYCAFRRIVRNWKYRKEPASPRPTRRGLTSTTCMAPLGHFHAADPAPAGFPVSASVRCSMPSHRAIMPHGDEISTRATRRSRGQNMLGKQSKSIFGYALSL